jgi:hypothetical protein
MIAAEQDLAARAPVWRALSDLYLDNEYRSQVRIAARELARSAYAADELRAILFDEVHPIVSRNLCAPAGVWDGFDQAWLAERILVNQRRPHWLRARGRCLRRYAELMWRLLAPRIASARGPRTSITGPGPS